MKIKKIIHKGFLEWEMSNKKVPEINLRQLFGKWQYLLINNKKTIISIVELKADGLLQKKDYFEVANMITEYPEIIGSFDTYKEALSFAKEKFEELLG